MLKIATVRTHHRERAHTGAFHDGSVPFLRVAARVGDSVRALRDVELRLIRAAEAGNPQLAVDVVVAAFARHKAETLACTQHINTKRESSGTDPC